MKHLRLTSLALLIALLGAFVVMPAGNAVAKNDKKAHPLKGVKATAKLGDATVAITEFGVNEAGKLVASGTVTSAQKPDAVGTFSNAEVTVLQQEGCQILYLRLAPIDLNLLGLRVQTSVITLVITAHPGEGLLGDLLCAVNNLLNPTPTQLAQLLNTIVGSLGGQLPTGTVLTGLLPINFVNFREQDGGLVADFVVRTAGGFVGPFTAPVTLLQPEEGVCTVLSLVLGPLDLTLLGLQVQLYGETEADPIEVLITADPNGGLLGNLLCGISRILDGTPNLTPLQRSILIARILNRILGLLG